MNPQLKAMSTKRILSGVNFFFLHWRRGGPAGHEG